MEIPLLSKEDIEKEEIDGEYEDIRKQIIEFLKSKGCRHISLAGHTFAYETSDFFIKDEQLVEVIVSDEIPEEFIEQMEGVE